MPRKLFLIRDETKFVFACKYTINEAKKWIEEIGNNYEHKGNYKITEGRSKLQ